MPGLVLRALRWRAGLSLTVWICAVVVCAGAALGPVFALAAAESGLQDVLREAGASTGVRLLGTVDGSPQVTLAQAQQRLTAAERLPGIAHRPDRIGSLYVQADGAVGSGVMHTRMVWRDGVCSQVRLTAGRCPTGPGEAMVSSRSVSAELGWKVGEQLTLTSTVDGFSTDVRIVGAYTPISTASPRWSGQSYFQIGQDKDGIPFTDTVFVSRPTFGALPPTALMQQAVDLPLDDASVRIADLDGLRAQLGTLRAETRGRFTVSSDIGAVLDDARTAQARIDAATALVVLQLCVLGWLVLHRVLVDTVEARSADIALAKLRGFRRLQLLRFGLGEPFVLLLVAVPVGAALAYAGALLLTRAVLLPATPVVFPWQAGLALVAAVAGGVGAIVQSAWSALRRPVLDQWRRTSTNRHGTRTGVIADVAVAVVALAAFVALRAAGPGGGPVTLIGPGLLVSAAGFGGARLLPVVLRAAVPATAASRRIALFLAVRQVARRPAGLRLVALLTVAVGLAVFGVGGQVVASGNRATRAAAEIGAARVVALQYTPGEDVVAQVRRADPQERWAAAAAEWLGFGGDQVPGAVLAVDASRLAAVGARADGLLAPAPAAALLTRGAVDPTVVRGRSMAVRITVTDPSGGPLPRIRFDLRAVDGSALQVNSDTLRPGTAEYRAAVPCARGCQLAGIDVSSDARATGTVSGTMRIDRLSVDGAAVDTGFARSGSWRAADPLGDARDRVRATSEGLEDRFSVGSGGTGGLVHGDVLDPVPAVVGGHGAASPRIGAKPSTQASDGSSVRLRVVDAAPVVPVVLDDGVLVDLRSFQAALPTFAVDAQWSVWLGPRAPKDAVERLRAQGLVVDGGTSIAARDAELTRQGPALALLLLAVCAVTGALLAMGGTAVSIGAAVRRRSYEAAALGTVGIRRGQLYGAALVEQLLLLGTAVVVGVPAGVLALVLALPAVPQFADDSPVPLAALPPALPIVLCAVVLVALVTVTVLVSAARVVRAGSATRLREAEE
ncbi:FtsX-like permease family protein [Amnibacterium kyonggiense]|uniref:FtsX-like permease family protein n=1 Tax=Amnibacterium kyonggiense TaxID=595671 RepID=A0A4R7FMB2_9MICO|nr:FtsX-like permease family protein [Amnibacterium kyonggiense]TDS77587.1 FtsX-like permease family protein [Amnibacterium kyonggiense]